MPTWMPVSGAASRGRHRGVLLACTGLVSGLGVIAWAAWLLWAEPAVASSRPETLSELTRPAANAAGEGLPAASPEESRRFDQDCLRLMRERLFRQAFKACGAYRSHPALAGRAHTALSALYTDPGHLDTEASVQHAQQALAMGEPRARILMASHLMAGHLPPQGHDLIKLLTMAEAGRIPTATAYLQVLRDSERCRHEAKVKPLGQPLFCLSRAEVHQALSAQGISLRRRDDLRWQDDFSPGDLLAQAQSLTAQFDVDPEDSIHRLARLVYAFDGTKPERRAQLAASLAKRYGPAKGSPDASGEATWALPDGIVVRLQGPRNEGISLVYEHPQRWAGRARNLQQQQAQMELDLVKADANVL